MQAVLSSAMALEMRLDAGESILWPCMLHGSVCMVLCTCSFLDLIGSNFTRLLGHINEILAHVDDNYAFGLSLSLKIRVGLLLLGAYSPITCNFHLSICKGIAI